MLLRLTKKASEQLKIKLSPVDSIPVPLSEWFVNLFIHNRRKYFIATEALSLFSCVFSAKNIRNTTDFNVCFIKTAEKTLADFNILIHFEETAMSNSNTNSRRVLGSMNDMINISYFYDLGQSGDMQKWTCNVNQMPMSLIDMEYPVVRLKKLISQ